MWHIYTMLVTNWCVTYFSGFFVGVGNSEFSITCLPDTSYSEPTGSCVSAYCGPPLEVVGVILEETLTSPDGDLILRYRCADGSWFSRGMNKVRGGLLTVTRQSLTYCCA